MTSCTGSNSIKILQLKSNQNKDKVKSIETDSDMQQGKCYFMAFEAK
jgi:hypothetical protein